MAQYHLNDKGEAGPCKAMVQCPFGDLDTDHYETLEDARAAYEKAVAGRALLTTPKDSVHEEWIKGALADGWVEVPGGPYYKIDKGNRNFKTETELTPKEIASIVAVREDGDKSVLLQRGDAQVWLVERIPPRYTSTEIKKYGWYRDGLQAMVTVPDAYSNEAMDSGRGVCFECKQPGDADRLKPISFAGRVCPTCDTPALRAKLEPKGWTN